MVANLRKFPENETHRNNRIAYYRKLTRLAPNRVNFHDLNFQHSYIQYTVIFPGQLYNG